MGLLEKAQNMRGSDSVSLKEAASGLRSRAEVIQQQTGLQAQPVEIENGIQIKGLLRRAEAMRLQTASDVSIYEESIPASPQGLLRRAQAMRSSSPGQETPFAQIENNQGVVPLTDSEVVTDTTPDGAISGTVPALDGDDGEIFVPEFPELIANETEADETKSGLEVATARLIPETGSEAEAASESDAILLPELQDGFSSEGQDAIVLDDSILDEILPFESLPADDEHSKPALSDTPAEADKINIDQTSQSQGLLAKAESMRSDEKVKPVDDLELSRVEEENVESNASTTEKTAEIPVLHYTGNSESNEDPALDDSRGQLTQIGADGDVFDQWENEARSSAEMEVSVDSSKDTRDQLKGDHDYLFDPDSDFTTAPVEAHIASQKKIDHYLALFDISKEISNIIEFDDLWENLLYALMGEVGAETICIFSSEENIKSASIFYPVAHSGFDLPEGWQLGEGDEIFERLRTEGGGAIRAWIPFCQFSYLSNGTHYTRNIRCAFDYSPEKYGANVRTCGARCTLESRRLFYR